MRKLILHIGAHKTGTTAIQEQLLRHKLTLMNKGWSVCAMPGRDPNWGHMFRVHHEPNGGRFSLNLKVFGNMLAAIDTSLPDVILSAEDLWFLGETDIKTFGAAMNNRFDQITLVAYVRRQDRMAISHWLQGGKTVQSAMVFGGSDGPLKNINPAMIRYLDYAAVLQAWQAAFPRAKLVGRVYERSLFPNGNVVEDFLVATELDVASSSNAQEMNPALGATTARFVYMLREAGVIQSDIMEALRRPLIEITHDTCLPARKDAQEFVDYFAQSNRELGAILGRDEVFSDDFSFFPIEGTVPSLNIDYVTKNLLVLLLNALRRVAVQAEPK